MKTLKQLVAEQQLTGEGDIKLIERWFIENDLEQEGLKLIADLSYMKSNKLEQTLNYARTWAPYICAEPKQPPRSKKRHYYDRETEKRLMQLTQYHLLKMPLPDFLLDWAKENVPKMEEPSMYFQPTIEWLDKQYGIRFKEPK